MQITDMNWMQLESYLKQDDRCVLPLGSTEQHGYLSLSTDSLLAERVGRDAAEPLGIPVFPVLAYGITPGFRAFPGSPSVRVQTYLSLVRDLLDSIAAMGFLRILLVNGHGGNSMASGFVGEWMCDNPASRSSSIAGGTPRKPGPRWRRSTRWPAMPRGWRTSPGPGCPAWTCPTSRSPCSTLPCTG